LLRWTSLLGSAAVLGALGATRTHQHHFTLFLIVVVGLSILTVGVFVLSASPEDRSAAEPGRQPPAGVD
jgi:hypothetical protein